MKYPMRGKWTERFYLVIGSLAALSVIHEFARVGLTAYAAGGTFVATFCLGAGGFLRHQRKVSEFKDRYPAWQEYEFPRRRWWRRRSG